MFFNALLIPLGDKNITGFTALAVKGVVIITSNRWLWTEMFRMWTEMFRKVSLGFKHIFFFKSSLKAIYHSGWFCDCNFIASIMYFTYHKPKKFHRTRRITNLPNNTILSSFLPCEHCYFTSEWLFFNFLHK